MIGKSYSFRTELDIQMLGAMKYHAIRVPKEVQSEIEFPTGTKQRFEGTVNGDPVSGALLPTGTGSFYIMVSASLRKRLRLELGDPVEVNLTIVDPNVVDAPEDILSAIQADDFNLFKWEVLTAGTKRGFLHEITSAKTASTRQERIQALVDRLTSAQPHEPIARGLTRKNRDSMSDR
ncbi:Protein of unknown function DUF1905 [Fimbriimonadaceae bacterium]